MERFFSKTLTKFGRIGQYIELGRPWNGVLMGLLAIFGHSLVSPLEINSTVLLFSVYTLAYMSATSLNDIYDENVDKINMPYRPLQRNAISKNNAYMFAVVVALISFLLSLLLSYQISFLLIIFYILGVIYSVPPMLASRRGALSQINLSLASVTLPLYSGLVFSKMSYILSSTEVLIVLFMTTLALFMFISKDFKDIKGDKSSKKKTIVLIVGENNAQKIAFTGIVLSFIGLISSLSVMRELSPITIYLSLISLLAILLSELEIIKNPENGFAKIRLSFFVLLLVLFFS